MGPIVSALFGGGRQGGTWRAHGLWLGSLLLSPVWLPQALYVRKTALRLPEALGPVEGEIAGAAEPLSLVVLGESTAAGVGAQNHEEALAGRLGEAVARNTGRRVAWQAIGKTGATLRYARYRLVPKLAGVRPQVVVIVLGVNDTIRLTSTRTFRRELKGFVEDIRQHVDCPVIFSSVPPVSRLPCLPWPLRTALGARASLLDQVLRAAAQPEENIYYANVFFDVKDAFMAEDGFHPSPAGYREWGSQLAEAVVRGAARAADAA
jgi:lysophospholipase L1-like esterase